MPDKTLDQLALMSPPGWILHQEDGATIGALLATALLLWFAVRAGRRWIRAHQVTGDDALTVAAALVAAMFGAQGMWGFLRATLHLPTILAALGFTLFELVMLVCALRARRNLLADSSSGPEGAMLWLFAGLAGFFSATHAQSWAEALFRLLVPSIAAWLWHRLMRLEHRQLTGKLSGINWRLTPERILIRLGLADPTDRTAAEVSAERTLTTLAIAARKAGRDRWGILGWLDRRRLDAALQKGAEYAHLSTDPAAQQFLVTTLGVLNGAGDLARLRPVAPWAAAVVARPDASQEKITAMAEAGLIDLDGRTLRILGASPTAPVGPRPGRAADLLHPVDMTTARPVTVSLFNRPPNRPVDGNRAAQDPDLDLTATVKATILAANAKGVGEQKIADDLKVSRHWVRKILGRDPQPVPTAVNGGHAPLVKTT
jgi:hypothetical protein